jgi:hypothetical protein
MMQQARGKSKVRADFGMTDYYDFYQEKYDTPEISRSLYNKIISDANESIIDRLLNKGMDYTLPHLSSVLTIRKDKRKPKIVDGKVVNNAPVDWVTTKKLWENDKEAKEKKILVKYLNTHTSGYVFRIYMKKFGSSFKHRTVYKFQPSRKFRRDLSARIKDDNKDKFDTYLLY